MVTTLGIVEVRTGSASEAQSGAVPLLAARRFGGKSLLEWVVRRVSDAQQLDDVVVVADANAQVQQVGDLVPPDVSVLLGGAEDSLGRLAAAARQYGAEAIVRVDFKNPFVDPVLIDRLITTAKTCRGCDYASYCSRDGLPTILSPLGLLAEWCRADALHRADAQARQSSMREDAMRYIYAHAELFQMRLIPLPAELDRDDLRLAIEVEEDWEHAQMIFEALGPESLEWQRIAGLLHQQPAIRQRMALLNRRHTTVS